MSQPLVDRIARLSPDERAALVRATAARDPGALDLRGLAEGPILDPSAIFLPAGRCSEAEVRRREGLTVGDDK